MHQQHILLTGAAGNVAHLLRPRLARPDRTLRLVDVRPSSPLARTGEEMITASINDETAMFHACQGVSAVLHLGGQSTESTIDDVLESNVKGTYVVLEAARRAGVKRVILASSNHAVGFTPRAEAPASGLPADTPPRPDTLYGLSKVATEAAGRLFSDRYGMDVFCLRIGTWFDNPGDERGLSTWLSPDDGARLVEACLQTDASGFHLIWGISRNTRRWFSLDAGEAIGFDPQDDSEDHAHGLARASSTATSRVGGDWCDAALGVPM